jgi:hypothetical protein
LRNLLSFVAAAIVYVYILRISTNLFEQVLKRIRLNIAYTFNIEYDSEASSKVTGSDYNFFAFIRPFSSSIVKVNPFCQASNKIIADIIIKFPVVRNRFGNAKSGTFRINW